MRALLLPQSFDQLTSFLEANYGWLKTQTGLFEGQPAAVLDLFVRNSLAAREQAVPFYSFVVEQVLPSLKLTTVQRERLAELARETLAPRHELTVSRTSRNLSERVKMLEEAFWANSEAGVMPERCIIAVTDNEIPSEPELTLWLMNKILEAKVWGHSDLLVLIPDENEQTDIPTTIHLTQKELGSLIRDPLHFAEDMLHRMHNDDPTLIFEGGVDTDAGLFDGFFWNPDQFTEYVRETAFDLHFKLPNLGKPRMYIFTETELLDLLIDPTRVMNMVFELLRNIEKTGPLSNSTPRGLSHHSWDTNPPPAYGNDNPDWTSIYSNPNDL